MEIITAGGKAGDRVIALGTFDGVHLGHQELIRRGRALAAETGAALRICVLDRHPLEILRPELAPARLQTPEEQAARLAELGVDELRVLPFTRETAEMTPEAFLRMLREECDIRAAVVGWNYTFGRGGRGDADALCRDGEVHGYRVTVVPPVRTPEGEVISSSAIRDRLTRGDLEAANAMLGCPYRISGVVVNGKHEGTRIGFPTANIETDARKLLPAFGVYACELESEGEKWRAVVNIGLQPTLPSGKVTVEAHALDARPNLYGKPAAVTLWKYLRGERRFATVEELVEQIDRDRKSAKNLPRTWN